MGACSGKLSGAKHGPDEKLSIQDGPEAGDQAVLESATNKGTDAVNHASGRKSPPKGKHSPMQRAKQPQDKARSIQSEHSGPTVKSEAGRELRRSAEFWSREGRLQNFSNKELVDLYKRDNTLLLDSVQRIEQTIRGRQGSSAATDSTRAQDDLQETAKPPVAGSDIGNGISTSASSDGLSPSTPRGVLDVRFSSRSEEASPWLAEPPSSAACAEHGGDNVRWLLERDPPGEDIATDYKAGRMLSAYNKLKAWCNRHEMECSSMEPYSELLGFDVAALREHHRIIQKMRGFLAVEEEKSYSVARDDGDLRLLYKQIKGTSVHCIKMEAVLSCPLEHALALAREFDLVSEWNSYVTDSLLLAAPTIWQSWVYGSTWMPFPIPQMDAVAQGRGYDLGEEERSLLIMIRSVEEAELPKGCQPLPKKAKKRKRITILDGSSIRFEALPPDEEGKPRTKGTIMARIDPHLPHVPQFLVTFVLSVLAPFAHRMIKQLLRKDFADPSKPFPRRMAAQPELYDRVRETVAEGLAKHYGIGVTAVGEYA